MDAHKATSANDLNYKIPLTDIEGLPSDPLVKIKFSDSSFQFSDFECVLNSRRNGSSPGINGVPYKVYKRCPQTSSLLFKIFTSCLTQNVVPYYWRCANEVYIAKTKSPKQTKI